MRLALRWGKTQRNQCARCLRYMGSGEQPVCSGCGASYREVGGGAYLLQGSP